MLARLGAAYRLEVEPDQLVVWADALARWPAAAGEEAVRLWIETQPRFPNPAQLIDVVKSVARRQAEDQGQLPAESAVPDPLPRRQAMARMGIAECRQAMATARGKRQDPEPPTQGEPT